MQIIEIVIAFFIIRFLVNLIDGIFRVNKVRQNIVRNFNQTTQTQQRDFEPQAQPKKQEDKGDYIDYEEVKSEIKSN